MGIVLGRTNLASGLVMRGLVEESEGQRGCRYMVEVNHWSPLYRFNPNQICIVKRGCHTEVRAVHNNNNNRVKWKFE